MARTGIHPVESRTGAILGGIAPAWRISDITSLLPGLRTSFRMQQGNDQHAVSADLVEHSVREAPNNTSPDSAREEWPCFWKPGNPVQRVLHRISELVAEAWSFSM